VTSVTSPSPVKGFFKKFLTKIGLLR
jgi:hypothetical protein